MKRSTKIGLCSAVLGIVVILGIGVFTIRCIVNFRSGIQLMEEGQSALQRRDYESALTKYSAAVHTRLDRHNLAIAYTGRSAAYNGKRQFDLAIRNATESIQRASNVPEAFVNRAAAYEAKGAFDRAIADYSEAIGLDPNLTFALFNRGQIFLYQGKTDLALADFNEAVRSDPTNPENFAQRGIAYRQKGYLESALASFESALRIDPKDRLALAQRSEILMAEANSDSSDEVKSDTDYFRFKLAHDLLDRGVAATTKGHLKEAIRLYTEALACGPDFSNRRVLLSNRGLAYDRLKKPRKAAKDYDAAILLDPKFVEAYYNRGINDRALGQLDRAIADYTEALRWNPRFSRAYVNRASIFLQRGEISKVIADYKAADETIDQIEPEARHPILSDLAWTRATYSNPALHDGKAAVREATEACELTKWQNSDYIDTLAAAHAEAGQFEKAVKYETQALHSSKITKADRIEMEKRLKLYRRHEPYRTKPRN